MYNILVIVDVQNDFVDGSLGTKEAQEMIPRLLKKIDTKNYDCVFCTMDTHFENLGYDYLSSKEGQKLPVKHCIQGTEGWKVNWRVKEALDKKYKNAVRFITKHTFGSESLIDELSGILDSNYEECSIEIVGLCTDICVIANAVLIKTAFYDNTDIIVDASCCAGVTPEKHKEALDVMKSLQIDIINE